MTLCNDVHPLADPTAEEYVVVRRGVDVRPRVWWVRAVLQPALFSPPRHILVPCQHATSTPNDKFKFLHSIVINFKPLRIGDD
jgi:hypothetical protein